MKKFFALMLAVSAMIVSGCAKSETPPATPPAEEAQTESVDPGATPPAEEPAETN